MSECSAYIGLDVHKDTIAVAVARPGRGAPESIGEIANEHRSVMKLVNKLSGDGELLSFCYEAGPCGYGLYRELIETGHRCEVVAPGLIPRKAGERIKTDRRDARKLSGLHRAGELTPVWVPDEEQEAIRDLTRAREDMKAMERGARQRLGGLLLRHGWVYREGKSRWTQRHFQWLGRVKFANPIQQWVLEEYIDMVLEAQARVARVESRMRQALEGWSLRPVVEALRALRGVELITAMTLLAELGDITRFDSPRELMSFLGLVPSEHSSGRRRRQGSITKCGNGHVRRLLVESAWSYRHPARKSAHMRRKVGAAPREVQAIAWAAQRRLCGRFRHLLVDVGKAKNVACTAVARELVGFIWAIACEVSGKPHGSYAHFGGR